jgi:carbamoyl-phosphate synthase large subunit
MGVGQTFAEAFVKSQLAAGERMARKGKVFISVRNDDKTKAVEIARMLTEEGFEVCATRGTAAAINAAGVACQSVNKVAEGRPHIVDMIKNREINMIVNTVDSNRRSIQDSWSIRNSALQGRIPYYTTISGARAACLGLKHHKELEVYDVQNLHRALEASKA